MFRHYRPWAANRPADVRFGAHCGLKSDTAPCPTSAIAEVALSFDHLIAAGEQRRRHAEAERLRGLQVDSQFEFCRLLDRDVARLRPAQNLVDKFGGASVQVHEVWSIGPPASTNPS
jgi:hypothetical protein